MCVDLDGDAVLGAGSQDALHVHFVAGPPQELPPRDMTEDGGVRVLDRLDDPVGLLPAPIRNLLWTLAITRSKSGQNLVGIIEGAVAEDVGVDALEDLKRLAEGLVDLVDLALLRGHFVGLEAAGIVAVCEWSVRPR